jgi:release factor glutamine methyltransferase
MKVSLQYLWKRLSLKLTEIENPQKETLYLLKQFLNLNEKDFLLNKEINLSFKKLKKLYKMIEKRNQHIPLAYILNRKEFFSMEFYVNQNVLIPRPETELLVELFLKKTQNFSNLYCLDIGTGTGCIPISILNYTTNINYFLAIDISKKALKVAEYNKKKLLNKEKQFILEFKLIDFINEFYKIKIIFDVIISNPPYILPEEYAHLDKELYYEPEIALKLNNPDNFYQHFFKNIFNLLKPDGLLFLESSPSLIPMQMEIINKMGFKAHWIEKDYQSLNRFLIIKK